MVIPRHDAVAATRSPPVMRNRVVAGAGCRDEQGAFQLGSAALSK